MTRRGVSQCIIWETPRFLETRLYLGHSVNLASETFKSKICEITRRSGDLCAYEKRDVRNIGEADARIPFGTALDRS